MITETYTLPAYWASALINGDNSGMDDKEIMEMEHFIIFNKEENKRFYCIDCSEEQFFGTYKGLGCDLLEYTFDVTPIN